MKKRHLAIICIASLAILAGCGKTSSSNGSKENSSSFVIQEEIVETYDLNTDKGVFKYPVAWKDSMRYEENGNQIVFYGTVGNHEEQILFTLVFGESDGYLLGTLNGEELHIIDSDANYDDSWSEEEQRQLAAMQEDFNVILDDLLDRQEFELASQKR